MKQIGQTALGRELEVLRPGWRRMQGPIAIGALLLLAFYLAFGVPAGVQGALDSAPWVFDAFVVYGAILFAYLAGSITWDLAHAVRSRSTRRPS